MFSTEGERSYELSDITETNDRRCEMSDKGAKDRIWQVQIKFSISPLGGVSILTGMQLQSEMVSS